MIHPEAQKVLDYPNTAGKKLAMENFHWDRLDKVEEVMQASSVLRMAKLIDGARIEFN